MTTAKYLTLRTGSGVETEPFGSTERVGKKLKRRVSHLALGNFEINSRATFSMSPDQWGTETTHNQGKDSDTLPAPVSRRCQSCGLRRVIESIYGGRYPSDKMKSHIDAPFPDGKIQKVHHPPFSKGHHSSHLRHAGYPFHLSHLSTS